MSDEPEQTQIDLDSTPATDSAPVESTHENSAEAPKKTPRKKSARKRTAKKATRKTSPEDADHATEAPAESAPSEDKPQAEDKPRPERDDEVPEVFSASPDDMDDYGDKESRDQEQARDDDQQPEGDASSENEGNQKQPRGPRPKDDRDHNQRGRNQGGQQGNPQGKNNKFNKKGKFNKNERGGPGGPGGNLPHGKRGKGRNKRPQWQSDFDAMSDEDIDPPVFAAVEAWDAFLSESALNDFIALHVSEEAEPLDYVELCSLNLGQLVQRAEAEGLPIEGSPGRRPLIAQFLKKAHEAKRPIRARGQLEIAEEGFGFIVFSHDNYRLKNDSPYLAPALIQRNALLRGHEIDVLMHPPREQDSCPFVSRIDSVMGTTVEEVQHLTPFKELVPYYPTTRIVMEAEQGGLKKWDNISMRIVDLLSPIGLGQRGLIVAPPRTGKTVLLQGIANSIRVNCPDARLIVLLVDERPEEVTDFKRSVDGAEVIASTFDEPAESHVHAAEMVIEKSRRLVERGEDVIILLDSITRLARAYNTLSPNSGKILSGGVEATALQKPKRFFGSARNIEEGGSLTILGTALVETGSKMDEVIFEEFKGTGNMELHLDRELSNKRIFPALSFEKSGTRKEELLYHPDEMEKVYALRRAMKGVPSTEAMEMLIQRIKKTPTNASFLMGLAR